MKNSIFTISILLIFTILSCKKTKKNKSKSNSSPMKSKLSGKKKIKKIELPKVKDNKDNAKNILISFSKGEFNKIIKKFSPQVKKALPAPKLKQLWNGIVKVAGKYNNVLDVKTKRKGSYQVCRVFTKFEKSVWIFTITFDAKSMVAGFFYSPDLKPWKAPAYADKLKFKEEKVTIGSGKWALPGTLSIPKSSKPVPLVILVHGSGPNDRDETMFGNKVFKDIAWGLSSMGVAVLRYDKRTKVHSLKIKKEKIEVTLLVETVDDVVIAYKQFSNDKRILKNRIFILGHSLGGYAIPLIAEKTIGAAGYIMMAGSSLPLWTKIYDQLKYIFSLKGKKVSEDEKKTLKSAKRSAELIENGKLTPKTPDKDLPMGIGPAKYWIFLKNYKHLELVKKIKVALLILQGQRDYQVTYKGDFALWKKTLGNAKNVTYKSYPMLNHLFIAGKGKPNNKEYLKPGHVEKTVINDLYNFISKGKN